MEINGVANLMLILQGALDDGKIDNEVALKMKQQLDFLHKYMVEYHKAISKRELEIAQTGKSETVPPAWHEVRDSLGVSHV